MLLSPLIQETTYNWWWIVGALIALAVGWSILNFFLKLAWQVFTLGCLGLLILGGVAVAWYYWG